MQYPTTNLLVPTLDNIPKSFPKNLNAAKGLSDYYHAIGYSGDGITASEHVTSVVETRYPESGLGLFDLTATLKLDDGYFSIAASNPGVNMLVFKKSFLKQPEMVSHFLNVCRDHRVTTFFGVSDLASMREEIAAEYYYGHESYKDLMECEPSLVDEAEEEMGEPMDQDVKSHFSDCPSPAECSWAESAEKLRSWGMEPEVITVLDEVAKLLPNHEDMSELLIFEELPIEPICISSFGREPHKAEWQYLESRSNYVNSSYGYCCAAANSFMVDDDPLRAAQQFDQIAGKLTACSNAFARFLLNVIEPYDPEDS